MATQNADVTAACLPVVRNFYCHDEVNQSIEQLELLLGLENRNCGAFLLTTEVAPGSQVVPVACTAQGSTAKGTS